MIPESINDLSDIAINNVPQGGDNVGGTLDDILRAIQAIMKRDLALKSAETAAGTSFTPAASLLSKNVQAALVELAGKVNSLGSAATRNVGTSNGQVMEVGAFGVGGIFLSAVLDANDVPTAMGGRSGFYTSISNVGSTNVPYPYVYLQNLAYSSNGNCTQVAYSYNSDDMWIRHRYSNVWSSWVKFLTNNDTIPWSKITGAPSGFSRGMIMMWSGSVTNIPAGWALCNGANGTPDLRGRFVIGAGGTYAVGGTGGGSIPSHSHGAGTLATASGGAHTHTGTAASAGGHSHSASTNSTGSHSHSGTASSAGAHTHSMFPTGSYVEGQNNHYNGYSDRKVRSVTTASTGSAGAHTHSLSINSAGGHSHTVTVASGGAHTHTVSVTSAGDHTHTISGSTAAAGSGSEVIAKYYALCFIMKL